MHFRLARNRNTPRLARPLAQTALRVFLPPSSTTISTTAATQLLYDRARRDPTAESQELFSRDLKGYKKLQQRVSPTVLEKARILPGPKNMALLVPRGRKRFEVDRGEHDILTRLSSMAKQVLVLQQQEEARRQKEELLEEQRIAQEQEDREILLEYQSYLEGIKGTVHLLLQRLNRQFTFIRLDRLQPRFSHKNEAYFPLAYALQALARPSFRAEDVPAPFRPLNLNPQQLITLSRFVAAQDEVRLFEPLFERRYHLYPLRTNKAHPFVPLDNMLRNAALRPLLRSSTRHATTLATAPLTARLAGEILRLPVSDEIHALVRQAQDEGVTAVEGVLKRYLADHPTVQRRMHESIVSSARLSFEEEEEEGSRGRTVTLEPAEGRYEISSNTFSGLLQQVNDTRLRFEALTEEVNKDRQRTSALEARVSATEEELQFLNELLEVHEGLDEAKDLVLLDAPLACEAACPRFRMARLNPPFGESGPADTKLARSLLALHPGKPIPLLFRRFNLSYSDIATLSSTLTSSTYLSLHPSILRRFLKHASKRNPIVHSWANEEVVLKFISDAAEKCVPAKAEEVDEHFRASLGKLREKAQGTKKGRLRAGSKNKEGPLPGKKKEPKKVSK